MSGVMEVIYSYGSRTTNAQLMVDCRDLGFIGDGDRVLDATYGKGRFWTKWQPEYLTTNDLDTRTNATCHYDFTNLPWADGSFDVVVFDPPYKLNGTPNKGGPASSDEDYGVAEVVRWQDRHDLIRRGIVECGRVAGRVLMVKCQDQVCSGRKRWQTREFADVAEQTGNWQLVDMLHVSGSRPQPSGRRQVWSRGDYSTLLVFTRVNGNRKVTRK